jgi:hypothetical protein
VRRRIHVATLVVAAVVTFAAGAASAHTRSQSFSSWRILGGDVRVTFSVTSLETTRLAAVESEAYELEELLTAHLGRRLSARAADAPCPPIGTPRALRAGKGYVRAEWEFRCPTEGPIEISSEAFFEVAPSHVHYARIRVGDDPPVERLFTATDRAVTIGTGEASERRATGASFWAYLALGVEHILAGFDHLAFLLALLLLCRRVREVVFMVTGFTIGHSITLSLAALGVLEPNVPVIEAMIGFTIAVVAAENIGVTARASRAVAWAAGGILGALTVVAATGNVPLSPLTVGGLTLFAACYLPLSHSRRQAARLRPTLTLLFGLIHGCGFAAVLLQIGLPTDRLIPALLGFNVGVEIGQLCVVGAVALAATAVRPFIGQAPARLAFDSLSAALCALGLFWFVERGYLG